MKINLFLSTLFMESFMIFRLHLIDQKVCTSHRPPEKSKLANFVTCTTLILCSQKIISYHISTLFSMINSLITLKSSKSFCFPLFLLRPKQDIKKSENINSYQLTKSLCLLTTFPLISFLQSFGLLTRITMRKCFTKVEG